MEKEENPIKDNNPSDTVEKDSEAENLSLIHI